MAYADSKAYALESEYQEDAKDVRYPRYVLKERIYQMEPLGGKAEKKEKEKKE